MYLFDTSAIIDWLYEERLGKKITTQVSISVLSMVEILPAARKKSKKTLKVTEEFLLEAEKIPISEEIARICSDAKYKLDRDGKEKMLFDILIASTAKHHQLTLITLDRDFEVIGEVLDFDYEIIQ
ncbi:MAG: type II toxin-antitoxin system VapC family toxin [Candidatus Kariarchaeaceae archaeon]|jgi:predicted nucleic acid-binding protein